MDQVAPRDYLRSRRLSAITVPRVRARTRARARSRLIE